MHGRASPGQQELRRSLLTLALSGWQTRTMPPRIPLVETADTSETAIVTIRYSVLVNALEQVPRSLGCPEEQLRAPATRAG